MNKRIECDDETFYNASIDFLIEALTDNDIEECQKQQLTDTDDNFEKIELYQRKTTNEERYKTPLTAPSKRVRGNAADAGKIARLGVKNIAATKQVQ